MPTAEIGCPRAPLLKIKAVLSEQTIRVDHLIQQVVHGQGLLVGEAACIIACELTYQAVFDLQPRRLGKNRACFPVDEAKPKPPQPLIFEALHDGETIRPRGDIGTTSSQARRELGAITGYWVPHLASNSSSLAAAASAVSAR